MSDKTLESNPFKAKLIAESSVDGIILNVYENRIHHIRIPRFKKVTMEHAENSKEFIQQFDGKFYNIFEFESFADVDPEIRNWASSQEGNQHTFSDAIVIKSLPQKIMVDFYMRFNRPISPTRFFFSLDKAIDWTFEQMQLHH